jgi:hypothetical protein
MIHSATEFLLCRVTPTGMQTAGSCQYQMHTTERSFVALFVFEYIILNFVDSELLTHIR